MSRSAPDRKQVLQRRAGVDVAILRLDNVAARRQSAAYEVVLVTADKKDVEV